MKAATLLLLGFTLPVTAQVYQRVDPHTGTVTYTNFAPLGSEVTPLLLPEPKEKKTKVQGKITSPVNFPRVSQGEQKARDLGRLAILNDELQIEQKLLAEAGSKNADSATLHLHRSNIAAIQREIELVTQQEKNLIH